MEDPKQTNTDSDQIKALLAQALERESPQARADFLQEACAGNAALQAELESLLEAHAGAGDFLETPPPELVSIVDKPALSEGPGTVIDSYKLLEMIGEGGMAVVYMAEQDKPLRRRVALKIIKLGMDTKQVIARFDAERQALALMDHPNIARVYDAGSTETGRPYFVMELVRGLSITKYCDQNKLNTTERLKLFAQVCQAVHHAHQKGIIHRDLKPSNIMVTLQDGIPLPKVIDFGIAKATNQRLTEQTVFTRYTEMIGTPEYMSPEQAEMSAMDVDTRTDIYSLGIVLYELLTGTLPFDADTLRAAALGEIQRIIREEEPLRPSTRISSLGQAAQDIAARRCTDPGTLAKHLSRELEWIPLKAMRKERTRRYTSAAEFALDIHNYLHDRPLLAGPESPLYRLRKAVRKYRALFVAGLAVVAALIIGLIISTTLYIRLNRAQGAAEGWKTQAMMHESLAAADDLYAKGRYQEALNEISTKFEEKDMVSRAGLLEAKLLLELGKGDDAEARLNELAQAGPEIASTAHSLLARLYMLDKPAQAEEHRKKAEALLPDTAEAYYLQGMSAASAGDAVDWLTRALKLDPGHYAAHKARTLALLSLKRFPDMTVDAGALVLLRPYDYLGYALRAIARRETGQFTEALEDHNQAIKLCSIDDELARLYDQRRETLMRSARYQTAVEDARQHDDYFTEFAALTALGQYDQARAVYTRIAKQGVWSPRGFKTKMEAYTFELVNRDQALDLPPDIALKSPFYHMVQAAAFYERFREMGTPAPGSGLLGDWSPNGPLIAYGRFGAFSWLPGTIEGLDANCKTSFIEILDLKTGETSRVTRRGLNPIWSPDGKSIAFSEYLDAIHADVWVLTLPKGTPHKLAQGVAKGWSADSKRVYFTTRPFGKLRSIAVDMPDAKPIPILAFQGRILDCCAFSPERSLIAVYFAGELCVLTFPEGREVTHWKTPWPLDSPMTQLQWHPDGKTVMLNSTAYYNQMGMCLFNIDRKEATHVFNLSRPWCRAIWSPDGSQLMVIPYSGEARLLKIDPEKPLAEALAPALTTEEYLAQRLEKWNQRIKADPLTAENYIARAVVALGAGDFDRARQDIKHSIALIQEPNDPAVRAIDHWASSFPIEKRPAEAELWALGRVRLAEKFPAQIGALAWFWHPYKQLIDLYAAQGKKEDMLRWREKWLQDHALAPGSLAYNENTETYTITGSGRGIGKTWDEFHFAYKVLEGDGMIVAKVDFPENADNSAVAGVMIRNSLEPDARQVSLTLSGWVFFKHREAEGQRAATNFLKFSQGTPKPQWIRLERRGNSFTAHHSPDGEHWELIRPDASSESSFIDIEMNEQVYIGLAVTSGEGPHVSGQADFSQVNVTGNLDSDVPFTVSRDIGSPADANAMNSQRSLRRR